MKQIFRIEVTGGFNDVPLAIPEERLIETIKRFLDKGYEVIIHSVEEVEDVQ